MSTLAVIVCASSLIRVTGLPVMTGSPASMAYLAPEYAVYSAVIRDVVLKDGWGGNPRGHRVPIGRVVILERTRFYLGRPIPDYVKTRMPTLDSDTDLNFASKSASVVLKRQFAGIGTYELLTDSARQSMTGDRNWTGFYSRFPDAPGTVTFSNVGINQAGTQAVLTMMHSRAGLWGQQSFYLLRKTDVGWEVVQRVPVGAS